MTEVTGPHVGAEGEWLRGNLHAHTTVSDGDRSPAALIDDYEARGYDFLAISDHDVLVDPAEYRDRTSMALLPAVEVSADGPHALHVGATERVEPVADRQAVLDDVAAQGALAVMNHPNWGPTFDHCSAAVLAELDGYAGIEIHNGLIDRHPGAALATDKWDRLLADGRRVWGFANDDAHAAVDVGNAWNVVQVERRTPSAILEALEAGRFYGTTGVTIDRIGAAGGTVSVAADADRIRLVSDGGVIQRAVDGPDATFDLPADLRYRDDHSYVRIECLGGGGRRAWTQPFFLE